MKLDDFNNIDLNNAGILPWPVKIVLLSFLFALLVGFAYWFSWSDGLDSLEQASAKELELKTLYTSKKKQAVSLEAYKQQMVEIEKTFGALLKQLPNKSQMDALIDDINKAGLTKGLEFDLFKPGTEVIEDFYAEMPIAIKVLGSYHEFGNFASDLSKLSRIVTLNDLTITLPEANAANKDAKDKNKKENEPSFINLEVTAKTYRYLDDDEIAAKKAALKAKELPK